MTDKYKDKYRTETTRLKGWDYASKGHYFVTICEKNRNCVFGDICDDTVAFTPLGKVAIECWMEIPEHFPFVELDAFCVMPNHIHGIIVINTHDSVLASESQDVETQNMPVKTIFSFSGSQDILTVFSVMNRSCFLYEITFATTYWNGHLMNTQPIGCRDARFCVSM
jgi:REP element-mobilizing transposase RayT